MDQNNRSELDEFLDAGIASADSFSRDNNSYHELVHRVFVQSEAGAQLLEELKEQVLMTPSIQPQYSQYESALIEGRKELVRGFINSIKSVEQDK